MDSRHVAGTLTPNKPIESQICPSCGRKCSLDAAFCPEDGTVLARDSSLIGKTLAEKYLIEEELGVGGMCIVYKAKHILMGKIVAVKVLRPHLALDKQVLERFQLEARAAGRIHNPHAINVTDFGMTPEGCPFLVMDFIQGETLGEIIKKFGALTVERTADILQQVAIALAAAHEEGVIHRDIKPDNIIISEYDGRDWVTVLDFGVAKIQEDLNRRTNLTGENLMVGTPRYMSPEQAENKPVDLRIDIYSLGVVVYEMLAGEAPFNSDSATSLLLKHTSEPPLPLRQKRPDISSNVEAVVMRALSKDPSMRQQSAIEFSREFNTAASIESPAAIDRGGAFTRINVPIGSDPALLTEEATLIRPRGNRDISSTYLPLPGKPVSTVQVREEPSPWPSVVLALLVLAVIGVGAYIFLIRGFNSAASNTDEITKAQQAVVDARARIESLPAENNPLRNSLPQLIQWQGELSGFAAAPQKTPEMLAEAHSIDEQATNLSSQAKKLLSSIPKNENNEAAKNSTAGAQPSADKNATSTDKTDKDTDTASDPDKQNPKSDKSDDNQPKTEKVIPPPLPTNERATPPSIPLDKSPFPPGTPKKTKPPGGN